MDGSNKISYLSEEQILKKQEAMLQGQLDLQIQENVKKVLALSIGEFTKFKRIADVI